MSDFNESDLRTTVELLELLRKYQVYKGFSGTDYRIAKVLGVTPQTVGKYFQHGVIISDETAMNLAAELNLPPSYVLLCAWHERNKNQETKDVIKDIAAKYMKVSVFLFAFTVIFNTFTLLHNFT